MGLHKSLMTGWQGGLRTLKNKQLLEYPNRHPGHPRQYKNEDKTRENKFCYKQLAAHL